MTQTQRIDRYIRDFGSITNRDAMNDLGIQCFTARISEMRKEGYSFVETWEHSKNRYGEPVSYKRYSYGE